MRVDVGFAGLVGVGVHERGGQPRDRVQEIMLGGHRDLMRRRSGEIGCDHNLALGPQLMADPAQADLAGAEHAVGRPQGALGLVDEGGIDGVHQPPVDLAGRLAQHRQDGHGDEQADDRVGPVPADRDAARPDEHGQRGQPVGAGMQAVRDQRGRADLPSGPDPIPGRHLVAREADERRDGDRNQVRHVPGVQQPVERLVGGQRRGRRDRRHDHDPGQVLGPPVAIGIAAGRRAAGEQERDRERHRGERVGGVVQRVAEQRDRPGRRRHDRLDARGRPEHGERDPERSHALGAGFEGRVDLVGGLVRMRAKQGAQPGHQAVVIVVVMGVAVGVVVGVAVAALVVVIMLVAVGVPVVAAAGLRVAHDPRMPPEPCCSISTTACPTHLPQVRGGRVKRLWLCCHGALTCLDGCTST
jgi:hypothetical protein